MTVVFISLDYMDKLQFYCLAFLGWFILVADQLIKVSDVEKLINNKLALGLPVLFPSWVLMLILFFCFILFNVEWALAFTKKQWLCATAWFWLTMGTGGNMIDRWNFGGVVDYIPFLNWTKFNLSDVLIVVGMALLVLGWKTNHKL